jgi:hypothetical protein
MTLLTICQNATDEVGLSKPASVIGSTDATAVRCFRYAVRTGREFVKANIPYLYKEHTFSTVAAQNNYTNPTDFDHFVPFTNWNRTTSRRMLPILPNNWQELKSGLATVSINDQFRIRGSDREMLLEPTPTSIETVSFEYVSKNYCENAGGTGQSVWSADTDVGVIDEELFELSLIWRLLNRMGEPYAEEKAEYQRLLNTMKAQINPQKVHLDGHIPTPSNIPDANFPSA